MAVIRILLIILCTCINVSAQIITTIAGTGRVEFSGDGGPATKAGMNQPSSITTDKYGCIYLVDAGYNIVRKINSDGIIHTIIGNYQEERIHPAKGFEGDEGPATDAVLWKPRSIITDNGNIYLGDFENSVIRKVNAASFIHTVAGFPQQQIPGNKSTFTRYSVSDSSNSFRKYFADEHNNTVHCIALNGKISTVAGNGIAGYSGDGGPAKEAELNKPYCIAEDSEGNLFIADAGNNVVRKVNPEGIITTIAGNGRPGYSGDGGPATEAQINGLHGIATDKSGNLYITDATDNLIRRVDASGTISTFAGNGQRGYKGDKGLATVAQLNYPLDVAVDGICNVYIADAGNHVVRKVAATQNRLKDGLQKVTQLALQKLPQKGPEYAAQMLLQNVALIEPQYIPQMELKKVPEIELRPLPQIEPQNITQVVIQKEALIELQKEALTEPQEIPVKDAYGIIADAEKNELVVTTDSNAYNSFTITNMSGKVLIQQSLNEVKTDVDIRILPTGRYFINLKKADKVKTAMFVKDK